MSKVKGKKNKLKMEKLYFKLSTRIYVRVVIRSEVLRNKKYQITFNDLSGHLSFYKEI